MSGGLYTIIGTGVGALASVGSLYVSSWFQDRGLRRLAGVWPGASRRGDGRDHRLARGEKCYRRLDRRLLYARH